MRFPLPAALLLLVAGCAVPPPRAATAKPAATVPASTAAAMAPSPGKSYLAADAFDILQVIPPAPLAGDARADADRRIFRDTRAMQDSPRWQMAHDDADLSTPRMLKDFACSLDLDIDASQAPRLVQLLQQATRDTSRGAGIAKDYYKHQRPFFVDTGPICVAPETVGKTYDYPSGHATAGWTWGLLLAQVAPVHATAVLARGRAIGDSRIVCGVHNASAVEAARLGVGAAMTLVTASADYRADLDAARSEYAQLDRAARSRPDAASCRAESELVALPVLPHT